MTILTPVQAGSWLFWSALDDFVMASFVLQRYGGPLWWTDRFRILLLTDTCANGYLVASSASKDDITEDWAIIRAVYQEKVEKTGLSQFSESFLLNLVKKLAKKMARIQETLVSASHGDPATMVVPVTPTGEQPRAAIELGTQRRTALLFKALYHTDAIGVVERTFGKQFPLHEWVEWVDERTGMRPIHVAVERMDLPLLRYLLAKRADANIKDVQGWSPLHFAAFAGNLDICQLLVEQGNAAVLSISKDGTLPLHYLARHAFDRGPTATKFVAVLQLLLDRGTPIDAKTIRGETALHRACFFGSIQVASFLIDNKAELDIQNKRGETPLYFAVLGRHKQIVTLLVENGANCTLGGETGTALDAARMTEQRELLCFLSGFSRSLDSFNYNEELDELEEDIPTPPAPQQPAGPPGIPNPELLAKKMKEKKDKQHVNHKNFYPHVFVLLDYRTPNWCSLCGYFLWGIRKQGFSCEICGYCVHPKCKKKAILTESCIISKQMNQKDLTSSSNSVDERRLESLYNQFNSLDKEQLGCLYKKEFGECLGLIINDSNSFSEALFEAFDSNKDGKMDLKDFLNGVSVLQSSSFDEQITFAFSMLDRKNKGYIMVGEMMDILQSIFLSLGNLKIKAIAPVALMERIFPASILFKKMEMSLPASFSMGSISDRQKDSLANRSHIGFHRNPSITNLELFTPPTTPVMPAPENLSSSKLSSSSSSSPASSPSSSPTVTEPSITPSSSMPSLPSNYFVNAQVPSSRSLVESNPYSRSLPSDTMARLASQPRVEEFSKEVAGTNRIYFEDYRNAMTKHSLFVQSLGLVDSDESTQEETHQMSKWMSFEGKEITLGHENWETMQYIMIGIRRAIGETITLPSRPLKQKDYDLVVDFKYNGWVFKDHAPFPFKKIRDKLEIDAKYFMFSLGPEKIFGNLLLGNLSVLCEVVSSGRSGSMFFRSNEGRFLIKTIPPHEETVLKVILPSYVLHIHKYPNSLLSKTLGCYSMMKTRDLRLIVMNNLFFTPLPIHEKYDLKGSTIGRHVDITGEPESESNIAEIALKDLDFKRKLNLGPEFKAPLMEQIEHDTKLLESHNICDYSLLVGVHRVDEFSPIALASDSSGKDILDVLDEGFFRKTSGKTSIFQQHYGGILSADKKEVYFIAIIDIFTTWDFRKKYENMFKSLVHDSCN
eukprot:gene17763-21186_t